MALPTRIGRLRLPVLCFVVSKDAVKDGDVEKAVTDAVAGGVTMVQLNDGAMPAGEMLTLARSLRRITRGKALLVINDRVDIAEASEADGVLLPENGLPTRTTRSIMGRYIVLGRSVHDAEAAQQAARDGAEFVIVESKGASTKAASKSAGVGVLSEITKDSSIPVIASGDITPDKIEALIKAGAVGVAVASAIASADTKAAAESLMTSLREAWANRETAVAAEATA